MLRARCGPLRAVLRVPAAHFSISVPLATHQPNAPLDIDPSFQALLKDVDMALLNKKTRYHHTHPRPEDIPKLRELEEYPPEEQDDGVMSDLVAVDSERRLPRRSPAAVFGAQTFGMVLIPRELQQSISALIDESDKKMLHVDARRLFFDQDEEKENGTWDTTYDIRYRSHKQASRHHERDGTAFASVALPAHYSAIYTVLDHVRRRLGPDYELHKIYDWGAGTGSGLWAAAHAFQTSNSSQALASGEDPKMAETKLMSYIAFEKREGLVSIGKRLLNNLGSIPVNVVWRKAFSETHDKMSRPEGANTIAFCAFLLSSLPNDQQRKILVKEMWASGAETIVLIDHDTLPGFQSIAEARELLLKMGRKEIEDPEADDSHLQGCHVVAPCPHDGDCPLYHAESTRLVCGFSQRLQRPDFVRKTKHAKSSFEDMGYSYVVIRRGPRPESPGTRSGRIGEVGKRELEKQDAKQPLAVLQLHEDFVQSQGATEPVEEALEQEEAILGETVASEDSETLQNTLRQEAYHWPRLVFAPLKRSGHIILDACAPEGKILRMTVPKSQGKQPFYDARKSEWGDLFPHEPKNTPQVRYQPTRAKRPGATTPTKGADIGKRGKKITRASTKSYDHLTAELKQKTKDFRKERRRRAGGGGESEDEYVWE